MKVNITMREVQYFESTEEMELTPLEYATYCKTTEQIITEIIAI